MSREIPKLIQKMPETSLDSFVEERYRKKINFERSMKTLEPSFSIEPRNPSMQSFRLSVAFGSSSNHWRSELNLPHLFLQYSEEDRVAPGHPGDGNQGKRK
ncbi:hypothetical protein Lal_00029607 [Lupinus albus]|nr:hypothetical protein Lal_00029607 [Lupinus albus]